MALRDHSLDHKITAAAMTEFSDKGYIGASLRKIAERAGVTVGAIQTRYRSKDDLFACLLKPLLGEIEAMFRDAREDYRLGAGTDFLQNLKLSMRRESDAILHLIFDHYEEAVLLLCRSAGSSLEHYFDGIVQSKLEESAAFFRYAGHIGIDERLMGLLISAQFDSYRRIVAECGDRKSAKEYMERLMTYHFGGWAALFDSADRLQEGMFNEV